MLPDVMILQHAFTKDYENNNCSHEIMNDDNDIK